MPWRDTEDPYSIWLSEIMLQQTQVKTVLPYYGRFMATLPTVEALAAASLERALKLWEGLGYYTRARHLHQAAKSIVRESGGRFPRTAAQWRELPGIGPYTAAAIASIAFGEPIAALDGNVKRVLSRLFHIDAPIEDAATRKELERLADAILDRRNPGDFNQALMELGARVCTPRNPRCDACPVGRYCVARAAGVQADLPVRRPRRPAGGVTLAAALVRHGRKVLLVRRTDGRLLSRLWALPAAEVADGQSAATVLRRHVRRVAGVRITVGAEITVVRHDLSHCRLHVRVFECATQGDPAPATWPKGARWGTLKSLHRLPLAVLDRKLLAAGGGGDLPPA